MFTSIPKEQIPDWEAWLHRFLLEFRQPSHANTASLESLYLGETDLTETPEFVATWLNFIAEETSLFETREAFQQQWRTTLIAPRPPLDEKPNKLGVKRSELPEYVSKLTDYHLAQDAFHQAREDYETKLKEGNAFRNQFSDDASGYRKYVDQVSSSDLSSFLASPKLIPVREDRRQRHSYVCGGTGSGKSEILKTIIHHYLTRDPNSAIVILDPHGDLGEQVARFKENASRDRLVFIDPGLSESRTPTLNPFDVPEDLTSRELDTAQQEITEQLGSILGEDTQLSANMEVVLAPCIATLLRRPHSTFTDLQRFMFDERNHDLMQFAFRHLENPAHIDFLKQEFHTTRQETKQAIRTRLQILLNSTVFRNFLNGPSTLDFEAALESKKLIIFNVSRASCGKSTALAIGRLIMAQLMGIAARRGMFSDKARAACSPIHLFVDESQHYCTSTVKEILDESRKFKLYLTLANQYIGQFENSQIRESVEQNTMIKLTGLMSSEKAKQLMAKVIGTKPEQLATLGQGQFFVRLGELPGFLLRNRSDLIDYHHSVDDEQWELMKESQSASYYRDIPTESIQAVREDGLLHVNQTEDPQGDAMATGPKYPLNPPKRVGHGFA
ncbi:MAG: DUF87 domain-containing protein [Verrucomicrobiota bacterium]